MLAQTSDEIAEEEKYLRGRIDLVKKNININNIKNIYISSDFISLINLLLFG